MTMPHDTFVELMHGYRDLQPPPTVGDPDAINRRITRTRRRRAAVIAGVTAIATLIAIGSAVFVGRQPVVPPADPMPSSFTAPDGVTYHRIGSATLDMAVTSSVTVTVASTGEPLGVLTSCDVGTANHLDKIGFGLSMSVAGQRNGSGLRCDTPDDLTSALVHAPVALTDLDAGHTAGQVSVTFNAEPTLSVRQPAHPARWRMDIYSWRVPATLIPQPAPTVRPTLDGGWKLASSHSGTLATAMSATFTVPAGVSWGLTAYCPAAIDGDRVFAEGLLMIAVDGHAIVGTPCQNDLPQNATAAVNHPITVDATIPVGAIYSRRGGTWAIALYTGGTP